MSERDDRFWAQYLDIDPALWKERGLSVRPHAGLEGYCGVWCFQRRERVVVSAPRGWVSHLEAALRQVTPEAVMDEAFLVRLFGRDVVRLIGPAFQGSLDPDAFRPYAADGVRFLGPDDAPAIEELRRECPEDAGESSWIDEEAHHLAARIDGHRILALTGYRPWSEDAGDPCVLTHPLHRGRGWATATTSAVIAWALEEGKLLLYQTLEANLAAVKLAAKLGYRQYARYFAVRLKREAP
jgi:GNAT superfamily N-acetyltransferase